MKNIRLEGISKRRNEEVIIDDLTLEIPSGKFFALLGPSGCGKTTLLRLIAGLDTVDSGRVYLGNEDITRQHAYERRINTVFQQYALFPHLTVFDNVAYGLRLKRKYTEVDIEQKVFSMLQTMRLAGHEFKRITQLSGGQQQRVALARAIVNAPDVLLLDEPLAALDLKLREQMLVELMDLQEKLNMTFVYVTHDQTEALTVADKMAIMNVHGRIEQLGDPTEIYEFPSSRFVATFVGRTNILEGELRVADDALSVEIEDLGEYGVFSPVRKKWMVNGCLLYMSLRPEKIFITKEKQHERFANEMIGVVENIIYDGRSTQYKVSLPTGKIMYVFRQNEEHLPQEEVLEEDQVYLYFQKENVILLER